jgi:hypothetical protein
MENIAYNISQVLGITIIHSLWQGLLIYFFLRVILLFTAWLPASKKIYPGCKQFVSYNRVVCLHTGARDTDLRLACKTINHGQYAADAGTARQHAAL